MVYTRSDEVAEPGFMAQGGGSERAFRGAQRHSRNVRLLRILIPAGLGLAAAVILGMTYFNPMRLLYKLPSDLGTLVISGSKITMESPRLAGFTRDSRAYEVNARAAAQDLARPDIVELKDLRAKIDMQDKSAVEMLSTGGVYNTKSEILTLGPGIRLTSTTGYEARLAEAVVDIRKGNIVSDKPVEVKMLKGTLNANRLEVLNAGELLRFDGGVAMTLMLDPPAGAKEQKEQNAEQNKGQPQAPVSQEAAAQ
ncbi:MAG: LPS export ABC transporter periplasmic protein LptC [Pseudorhodoplanes sp.]|nr:LPS export ABC transporter periplasmic protein LptC [Pseudorhodoplanes sp.]MCL4709988.1 LPS export ABC transporter periplasmic protein LptC [Pseudorhodoplanes sp.]MCZ7643237.1 LPS export ABC transporter periplasmic protein LptC [Pseudorhodoplanes sp.]